MESRLDQKTAIITGGGTGIGRSCAIMLAELGCNIVISYRNSIHQAEHTRELLDSYGTRNILIKADVTVDEDMRRLSEEAMKEFGKIDILINNAGTTSYVDMADLEGITETIWDTIMDTNVKGAFLASRACSASLRESQGVIINISSIAGLMGRGSCLTYAVSKGALNTLTKALARSLSPEVRVNAVAPGVVNTRWVEGREEHIERQTAGTLLGKVATADDVAETVIALITHAGFVTGHTLVVDGGFYL